MEMAGREGDVVGGLKRMRWGRRSVRARRWLLAAAVAAGAVILGTSASPGLLAKAGGAEGISLLLGIAGLIAPFLLAWLQRRWSRGDTQTSDQRGRARDRELMRKRVRNRWITGVLDQLLAQGIRLDLGLTRRPDMVDLAGPRPDRTAHRAARAEPLPAGTRISSVFTEAGGALLILGAPGSGKTAALLELTRDLLDQADADDALPMPAVFNLSSWAVRQAPLTEWLIDELRARYDVPRSIATRWVSGGEILPLLDGLDEVAESHRAACVEAINAFRDEYGLVPMVICSRTQEYAALATHLRVEDAVELAPPTRGQVLDYLRATGASLAAVQEAVEADPTLWEVLQSPLVLAIMALTYTDRLADALRAQGTPARRMALLVQAYVEHMLTHRPGRFTPAQTRGWLSWLARSMRARNQTEFHLDRLDPTWLPTKAQRRLAALLTMLGAGLAVGLTSGLSFGLDFGLTAGLVLGATAGLAAALLYELVFRLGGGLRAGLASGLAAALLYDVIVGLVYGPLIRPIIRLLIGLMIGLLFGLLAGLTKTEPVEKLRWAWPRFAFGLAGAALWLGLAGVLARELSVMLDIEPANGLMFTLVFALGFGLVSGLADERFTPNEGIRRSACRALAFGLGAGLTFGLTVGLPSGLSSALLFGLCFGGMVCLRHFAVRGILAASGFAPLRYVRFLEEATEQLLLRRVGSGYLFTHRLLLEYFAEPDADLPTVIAEELVMA
jgi:hypothetical protein